MTYQAAPDTVVVGLDDSDGSRSAVDWAGALAREHHLPVTLAHAYPDVMQPPSHGFAGLHRDLLADAHQIADQAEQQLHAMGWNGDSANQVLEPGTPGAVLRAASENARMLVVGRTGADGFFGMLVGSTAYGLAEHSSVPVVVVPDGWDEATAVGKPVVLAVDDSNDSGAIAFAFDFAAMTGRHLDVIHVCPEPSHHGTDASAREQWVEAQRLYLAETLAGWAEQYPDVSVDRDVVVGHPVGSLLHEAAGASLMVVGGKARGRLSPPRLGSVSRNLLHHVPCPIAVVHTQE